jgi:hypothetical protein
VEVEGVLLERPEPEVALLMGRRLDPIPPR